MTRSCIFCGGEGPLTGEHVFGDWLTRIGVDLTPRAHVAGPLNRIGQEMGVTAPFRRTVRDVCGPCNHGWMARLEDAARHVLTPLILGKRGIIEPSDQGAIAAWMEKTCLVGMLMSSTEDRERGYGLSPSEYHELYDRRDSMEPLPATQVWIGRHGGQERTGSTWVTPLVVAIEGMDEPTLPQGYAMTVVLGELLLHGVRFTVPALELTLSTRGGLPPLWPRGDRIVWPGGDPVDDERFFRLSAGKELQATEPQLSVRPWTPATELPESREVGSMVELRTICGEHVVYYPAALVHEAMRGRFYAFVTSCECPRAYLIETANDGAHCKFAGGDEPIAKAYDSLEGDEYLIDREGGLFVCKRLPEYSGTGRPEVG
jgi:hypothetical protein